MKVLVTGGSGRVGHFVIDELYKAGHQVVNADAVRTDSPVLSSVTGTVTGTQAAKMRERWPQMPTYFQVDIANYGHVVSAMDGCDAVISLASRPSAHNYTEEDVFVTNVSSMWNVCRAAEQLKISKVVLGSSYNAVGAMGTAALWGPKEVKPPEYFPLDQHVGTRSEDPYSIAKWVGEEIGEAFARRSPWMSINSMRLNGIWDDSYFKQLAANPITDPWNRCQGFWTYVHVRDAARACVMSVESEGWTGHNRMFLNADDVMIDIPTMDAIKIVYPDVPVNEALEGFKAPISTQLAKDVIGWRPQYSWRDEQFQP